MKKTYFQPKMSVFNVRVASGILEASKLNGETVGKENGGWVSEEKFAPANPYGETIFDPYEEEEEY